MSDGEYEHTSALIPPGADGRIFGCTYKISEVDPKFLKLKRQAAQATK